MGFLRIATFAVARRVRDAALIRVAEVHNRDGQKPDGQAVPAADRRGRLRDTSRVRPVADGGIDVDGVRSRSADSQGDAAHGQHKGRLRSEGLRARWSAHERGAIDTATAARRDPTKSCQARDPIRLSAHAPGGYVCSGKAPARQVISGLRGDAGCGNTSLTTQNLGLGAGSTRGVASWGCCPSSIVDATWGRCPFAVWLAANGTR